MSSDFPPGVFKGEFTFSPHADVKAETVRKAIQDALASLLAPHTEASIQVEYVPITK